MQKALILVVAAMCLTGCGDLKPATLSGNLMLNGKPFALPPKAGEVFISVFGLDAVGKIDPLKKYTGVVNHDGSFEIFSSGGEIPVGTYRWSIDSTPGRVKEFEPFSLEKSKVDIELKSGPNQIVLDLNQQ